MSFVELKMLAVQKTGRYSRPVEATVPFLEWKVGYTVKSRSNYSEWMITEIADEVGNAGLNMGYSAIVSLRSPDGEEERKVKGATLQTGYQYLSGAVGEDKPGAVWKPMMVNTAEVRNFYARKDDRPGSRVMMADGTAYVVADTYDELKEMFK